ncbi:MAG: ATP-binding protein [Blastocatellia bacterium]
MDGGILLQGACGVGKTHVAVAVLRSLVAKGIAGLFCEFRELLKRIQETYGEDSASTEAVILQPVVDCECLVLDELGAGKPTERVQETSPTSSERDTTSLR